MGPNDDKEKDDEGPFHGRDGVELQRGEDIDLSHDEDFPESYS